MKMMWLDPRWDKIRSERQNRIANYREERDALAQKIASLQGRLAAADEVMARAEAAMAEQEAAWRNYSPSWSEMLDGTNTWHGCESVLSARLSENTLLVSLGQVNPETGQRTIAIDPEAKANVELTKGLLETNTADALAEMIPHCKPNAEGFVAIDIVDHRTTGENPKLLAKPDMRQILFEQKGQRYVAGTLSIIVEQCSYYTREDPAPEVDLEEDDPAPGMRF